MTKKLTAILLILMLFVLAACSSDAGDSNPAPTEAPAEAPATSEESDESESSAESEMEESEMEEAEAEPAMPGTIAEVATEAGAFNTLLAALTAAELAGTFADADAGPFTVFAPTDDAFAALPEGTVEALLEDPAGDLTNILTYHVVEGAVMADAVVTLDSAPTLLGEDVTIEVIDGGVVLNGVVNVVTTDIEASNGVIHVIDAVLLPPTDEAMDAGAAGEMEEEMMVGTIAEVAAEAGSFDTLLAALTAADLAGTFADADAGPFTVFAPTDDAFAALPEGTVEALLEDPAGDLTNILTYHVVEGAVMAEAVVTLDSATTLFGEDVTIEVVDGGVVLNGVVNVVTTDIEASNGVIHVIDAVLLPPADEAMEEAAMADDMMLGTIAEIATEAGSFDTLLAALTAAELAGTFADAEAGPFTVFAPTDDAFAALPEGTVEALLEDPSGDLTNILTYHVVEGAVMADAVVTLDSAPTLLGEDVTIEVIDGGVVLNGVVNVVTTDIEASNGVIHVIDAVLLPPADEAMEEGAMADDMMLGTIAEIATEAGSFDTLLAALTAAELAGTFADAEAGPFTVFAPTDDAFAALPEGTVEALLEDPAGDLTNILTYHVVEGAVMADAVVTLDSATTLLGEDVTIEVVDGGVVLNGMVHVVTTDIKASNGVIHVIDAVLLPPADEAMEEGAMADDMMLGTIAEIATEAGSFDTLLAALTAADLAGTFADAEAGPFTVFAPTDDAFAALPDGTVEALLEDPAGALTSILTYHVVEGAVMAETVVTLDSATTLSGQDVTIEVVDGGVVLNGMVHVVTTDIEASNGVIHVIDAVLIPAE